MASTTTKAQAGSRLFEPVKVGTTTLSHRIIMAPLTRFRATDDYIPTPIMVEYYAQRASTPGTLLITEATFISPRAGGFANVPGIWSPAQIEAWKPVTDAVHAKGSYIYCQLWFLGRAANAKILANMDGEGAPYDVVSSSATPLSSNPRAEESQKPPRELSKEDIAAIVQEYAQAARNAIAAGFDGVEIHGANGYLVDQFTQDTCNQRTDEYGGSIEKRARFGLEVGQAVVDAVGADRTGIRLSPFSPFQGMHMEKPIPQFTYLIEKLRELKLAYLHVVESRISGNADVEATQKIDFVFDIWKKTSPVMIAGGFKPDSARRAVDAEYTDQDVLIVFGRHFISNPDLPFRIENDIELTGYNRDTFYKAKSEDGYTDYPYSGEFLKESRLCFRPDAEQS